MTKVSVIIAAYNCENTIEKCVKSICQQTLEELELIIVDDGSSDNTYSVCDFLKKTDSRICLYSQSNQGVQIARKRGVQAAQGEYICFVDCDDWCEPNMLEMLYSNAICSQSDISMGNAFIYREDKSTSIIKNLKAEDGTYKTSDFYDKYLLPLVGRLKTDEFQVSGYIWGCIFRRSLFSEVVFFKDLHLYEDDALFIQLWLLSKNFHIQNIPIYHYDHSRTGTISKRKGYWSGYWKDILCAYECKRSLMEKYKIPGKDYESRLAAFLAHNYLRSICNETDITNPCGFFGGLVKACLLNKRSVVVKNINKIPNNELLPYQWKMIRWVQFRCEFLSYIYYAVKFKRMQNFYIE